MKNPFLEHPKSVGETYLQHFYVAASVGMKLLWFGIVCFVHALLPFTFKTYVSARLVSLIDTFRRNHK